MPGKELEPFRESAGGNLEVLVGRVEHFLDEGNRSGIRALFSELHYADAAEVLDHLDEDSWLEIFNMLEETKAAEVFVELGERTREELLESLDARKISRFVELMRSDDAADIIGELEPGKARDVLSGIKPDDLAEVRKLLEYPEECAGGIMATEFVSVDEDREVEIDPHCPSSGKEFFRNLLLLE